MRWNDSQGIAIELVDKYPDVDPLTLSFEKLHSMICELEDFDDDPQASNEAILEGILTAWLEERD